MTTFARRFWRFVGWAISSAGMVQLVVSGAMGLIAGGLSFALDLPPVGAIAVSLGVAALVGIAVLLLIQFVRSLRDYISRPGDGPLETELIEHLKRGRRLRKRLASNDPPDQSRIGEWATPTIKTLQEHGEERLADRLYGRNGIHPPHDARQAGAYMDRRLDALRGVLRSLRGEG